MTTQHLFMNMRLIALFWDQLKVRNFIGVSLVTIPVTRWDWLKFAITRFEPTLEFGWLIPEYNVYLPCQAELVEGDGYGILLEKKGYITIGEAERIEPLERGLSLTRALQSLREMNAETEEDRIRLILCGFRDISDKRYELQHTTAKIFIQNRLVKPTSPRTKVSDGIALFGAVGESEWDESPERLPYPLVEAIYDFYLREKDGMPSAPDKRYWIILP